MVLAFAGDSTITKFFCIYLSFFYSTSTFFYRKVDLRRLSLIEKLTCVDFRAAKVEKSFGYTLFI